MLPASLLQGCLTNVPLQALVQGPLAASALASAAGNRLLPLLSSAARAQHSMAVQEQDGLPEHVHEDPRLAKIEAVRKKVRIQAHSHHHSVPPRKKRPQRMMMSLHGMRYASLCLCRRWRGAVRRAWGFSTRRGNLRPVSACRCCWTLAALSRAACLLSTGVSGRQEVGRAVAVGISCNPSWALSKSQFFNLPNSHLSLVRHSDKSHACWQTLRTVLPAGRGACSRIVKCLRQQTCSTLHAPAQPCPAAASCASRHVGGSLVTTWLNAVLNTLAG